MAESPYNSLILSGLAFYTVELTKNSILNLNILDMKL